MLRGRRCRPRGRRAPEQIAQTDADPGIGIGIGTIVMIQAAVGVDIGTMSGSEQGRRRGGADGVAGAGDAVQGGGGRPDGLAAAESIDNGVAGRAVWRGQVMLSKGAADGQMDIGMLLGR